MKKINDLNIDWNVAISNAEENYKFQPILTSKLDNHKGDFTELTLLEIVLWKTNRYPEINNEIIELINNLRRNFSLNNAKLLLAQLLSLRGFDLPMASTVLRFACPDHFQIIDQRVYRFINADTDVFKMPHNNEEKIKLYFNYIEQLKKICIRYGIPFNKSDRIIYQLDKELNKDIPINY